MVFNKNIFKAGLLQRTHTYKQYKTAGPLPPGSCPSYFNNFQVLSHVFIGKQIVKAFFRYGASTSYIILPFSHRYLSLAYLKDLKHYRVGPPNLINSLTNFMKTIVFFHKNYIFSYIYNKPRSYFSVLGTNFSRDSELGHRR